MFDMINISQTDSILMIRRQSSLLATFYMVELQTGGIEHHTQTGRGYRLWYIEISLYFELGLQVGEY